VTNSSAAVGGGGQVVLMEGSAHREPGFGLVGLDRFVLPPPSRRWGELPSHVFQDLGNLWRARHLLGVSAISWDRFRIVWGGGVCSCRRW